MSQSHTREPPLTFWDENLDISSRYCPDINTNNLTRSPEMPHTQSFEIADTRVRTAERRRIMIRTTGHERHILNRINVSFFFFFLYIFFFINFVTI